MAVIKAGIYMEVFGIHSINCCSQ